MSRVVRLAVSAVLVALSVCAQAGVTSAMTPPQSARLEPARMFDPQSESLFAALTLSRWFSPVAVGVFNVAMAFEPPLPTSGSPSYVPHGAGVANVNFGPSRSRAAFSPFSASAGKLAVSSPKLAEAPLETPSLPQTGYAVPALATAPPERTQPLAAVNFGAYAPYTPSLQGVSASVSVPARVGGMHFQTAFHAMQMCGTADIGAACASAGGTQAQGFSAGTTFGVRAGSRAIDVGLTSGVEHINNATAGMFPYVPLDPDAQAGLTYFGLSDVVSQSVGAGLAVPVNQHLTVGLQYNRSRYQGDYGTTLLPGLDASKDTYLGNVTYQLPNTSSAITLSARQYRYQDALAPNFNLTQTRADLNFTVKF